MYNLKFNIMRFILGVLAFVFFFSACTGSSQSNGVIQIGAKEFEKSCIASGVQLIDVRTQEEFKQGHISGATNISISDPKFDELVKAFDLSKPTYVYCLSGGRSADAVAKLQDLGFKEIVELKGGMMAWRNTGLKEERGIAKLKTSNVTVEALIKSKNIVLVDVYADWCVPCKKLKPILSELSNENTAWLDLKKVNADQEQLIVEQFKVEVLPTLLVFKNGKELWRHQGFITKVDLENKLKEFKTTNN